jgi:hypothetical protein
MGDIIDSLVKLYFTQIYSTTKDKMYFKSLTLAKTIAEMVDEELFEDKFEVIERLNWLYEHTSESLMIPLPTCEGVLESRKKKFSARPMDTIFIYDNPIQLHIIAKALADVYQEITLHVSKIAKALNISFELDLTAYKTYKTPRE